MIDESRKWFESSCGEALFMGQARFRFVADSVSHPF
jgi:hypothetical protein